MPLYFSCFIRHRFWCDLKIFRLSKKTNKHTCQKFWTFMWTKVEKNLLFLERFFFPSSEKLIFENGIFQNSIYFISFWLIFCKFRLYERSELQVHNKHSESIFLIVLVTGRRKRKKENVLDDADICLQWFGPAKNKFSPWSVRRSFAVSAWCADDIVSALGSMRCHANFSESS